MPRRRRRGWWEYPQPVPPFENTCSYCDRPLDPMAQWCPECAADIAAHRVNMAEFEARVAEGTIPPFSTEDVRTLLRSQMIAHRITINSMKRSHKFHAKNEEWGEARDRWEQRTGAPPKPLTAWLRQQDVSQGRQRLYAQWLQQKGIEHSSKESDTFRRAWKRETGGKK